MNSNILERILAGEDPEKIGKEFADELNKAVAEKNRQDEEAKSKEKKENELNNLARIVAVSLYNYINAVDPVLAKTVKDEVNETVIREVLDEVVGMVRAYQDTKPLIDKLAESVAEKTPTKVKVKKKNADDEIAMFLKTFGLI